MKICTKIFGFVKLQYYFFHFMLVWQNSNVWTEYCIHVLEYQLPAPYFSGPIANYGNFSRSISKARCEEECIIYSIEKCISLINLLINVAQKLKYFRTLINIDCHLLLIVTTEPYRLPKENRFRQQFGKRERTHKRNKMKTEKKKWAMQQQCWKHSRWPFRSDRSSDPFSMLSRCFFCRRFTSSMHTCIWYIYTQI